MTAITWTSRRAARFADLVDAPSARGSEHRADVRLEELLETVVVLRSVADDAPAARPEFVSDLRARLMAEADTALVPAQDRLLLTRQTSRRRPARLAAAGVALVLAGGTAGVAVAAENSLPGQSLYTLKQGLEVTGRSLQLGQADRGRYELHQASTRLDEVSELVQRGDDDQVSSTLSRFTASAGSGADALFTAYQTNSDPASVQAVHTFTASAMNRLDALSGSVPRADQPQLRRAAALVAALDQQADVLCAACGSGQALAVPYSLGVVSAGDLPPAAAAAAQEARSATSVRPRKSAAALTSSAPAVSNASSGSAAAPLSAATASNGVTKAPGVVKSVLPKVVGTGVASQAATAVDGVIDAASGVVGGTVSGAASSVTGLLGGTPKPKP